MTALDEQVGGSHYKKDKIQIWTFCEVNNISTSQGLPFRYIRRFKDKAGLKDLKKAKHCIDLLIEHYYPDQESCSECVKDCHGWSEYLPEINCKCKCHNKAKYPSEGCENCIYSDNFHIDCCSCECHKGSKDERNS